MRWTERTREASHRRTARFAESAAPVRSGYRRAARNRRHAGFSLFELLVVIAIIGVLAAAAIPRFSDFRAAAYDARSQQDLRNLASAQELYRAVNETYAGDALELPSFRPSEGVELTIEAADQTAFRASATHPGGRNTYTWDSEQQPALTSEPNG